MGAPGKSESSAVALHDQANLARRVPPKHGGTLLNQAATVQRTRTYGFRSSVGFLTSVGFCRVVPLEVAGEDVERGSLLTAGA